MPLTAESGMPKPVAGAAGVMGGAVLPLTAESGMPKPAAEGAGKVGVVLAPVAGRCRHFVVAVAAAQVGIRYRHWAVMAVEWAGVGDRFRLAPE